MAKQRRKSVFRSKTWFLSRLGLRGMRGVYLRMCQLHTSSLIRVRTAALSISLRGTVSWDRAAMSGDSLLLIFVIWFMDISLCEQCRQHLVSHLTITTTILAKRFPKWCHKNFYICCFYFSFQTTQVLAASSCGKLFPLWLILLVKYLYNPLAKHCVGKNY